MSHVCFLRIPGRERSGSENSGLAERPPPKAIAPNYLVLDALTAEGGTGRNLSGLRT